MNASKEEFLSALLDDEADNFGQRRLLDELSKDADLENTFSRYALIGEVMRSNTKSTVVVARKDFLAGIQLGLEDEPVYDEKVVEFARPAIKADVKLPNMNQRYVKYGMAAAVAAVAVVSGTMLLKKPSPTPEALAAAQPIQPAALVQLAQAAPIRSANQLDPQSRDVLKQYVAQHVKYASTTAIVPSVRAVSYSNDY
jgi:sigma-E factor negative regulatory protein RseA